MPHCEQIDERLYRAAQCRRYEEVERLAVELGQAVIAYVKELPKGDPRAAAASRKLLDTLSWSLIMMRAARSSCLGELRRVTTANRYSREYGQSGGPAGISLVG